ncbi:hypothetical protein PTSG_07760 [Salpingoeca rosetta]|nr:uncharacterized protein PTSG_07760 [Salpingoeca rosetta]EGD75643.1 hypothetical protein PTSG_07760 [Salpingoeca rosetta]|eukprot:XP_004991564.1 hypothetical protein PTSG_07760 [Salpingoeca rosetta]
MWQQRALRSAWSDRITWLAYVATNSAPEARIDRHGLQMKSTPSNAARERQQHEASSQATVARSRPRSRSQERIHHSAYGVTPPAAPQQHQQPQQQQYYPPATGYGQSHPAQAPPPNPVSQQDLEQMSLTDLERLLAQ